jgi:hypothetical protein
MKHLLIWATHTITPVEVAGGGNRRLAWQAGGGKDLPSYRIFRPDQAEFAPDAGMQTSASTATQCTDAKAEAGRTYRHKVLAVDTSGNASRP